MANQGDTRVSEADRDAAASRLREHFAAGRLTLAEFQGRLTAAFAATTGRELGRVTADLPHDGILPGPDARAASARRGWSQAARPRVRRYRRRRLRLRSRLLLAVTAMTALWLLIGFSLPHNGLLIAAFLLMTGLMGLAAGLVVGLILLARRAWRRAAWLEGLPLLAGTPPWLGRALWAGRTVWVGREAWRAGNRFHPAYPPSGDYPRGPWPAGRR
jgi:hypothetical protein